MLIKRANPLIARVRRGVLAGLGMATVFCVGVAVMMLVRLSWAIPLGHGPPISGVAVILSYWLCGAIVGGVTGLCLPLYRRPTSAILLTSLAVAPFFVCVRLVVDGLMPWTRGDTVDLVVMSLLFGFMGGATLYDLVGKKYAQK